MPEPVSGVPGHGHGDAEDVQAEAEVVVAHALKNNGQAGSWKAAYARAQPIVAALRSAGLLASPEGLGGDEL